MQLDLFGFTDLFLLHPSAATFFTFKFGFMRFFVILFLTSFLCHRRLNILFPMVNNRSHGKFVI